MSRVLAYHRPATVEEALSLLTQGSAHILGGGAELVGRLNLGSLNNVEVVDIQDLGLAGITAAGDRVILGAMASLQQLADAEALPGALRDLARAEEPSTLRTRATVGGVVAGAGSESALLAGLLAADAEVTVRDGSGERTEKLADVLAAGVARTSLIISVSVAAAGTWASAGTGRTPADVPIVAAVGRKRADGSVALAVTGVAATPILVDAAAPTAGLEPAGDFRGTAEYRRHLAGVLSARVMSALSIQ